MLKTSRGNENSSFRTKRTGNDSKVADKQKARRQTISLKCYLEKIYISRNLIKKDLSLHYDRTPRNSVVHFVLVTSSSPPFLPFFSCPTQLTTMRREFSFIWFTFMRSLLLCVSCRVNKYIRCVRKFEIGHAYIAKKSEKEVHCEWQTVKHSII
jgi:hypothetical protein